MTKDGEVLALLKELRKAINGKVKRSLISELDAIIKEIEDDSDDGSTQDRQDKDGKSSSSLWQRVLAVLAKIVEALPSIMKILEGWFQ